MELRRLQNKPQHKQRTTRVTGTARETLVKDNGLRRFPVHRIVRCFFWSDKVKIAFTVCDCAHVVHAGGDPERQTAMVDIPDDQVPKIVRKFLDAKRQELDDDVRWCYRSCSLSIVVE